MNDQERDELLSAYVDGETTAEETLRAEQILEQSAEARQLVHELRALRSTFNNFPRYSLEADFRDTVLRQAERSMLLGSVVSDSAAPDSTSNNGATNTSAASNGAASPGTTSLAGRPGDAAAVQTIPTDAPSPAELSAWRKISAGLMAALSLAAAVLVLASLNGRVPDDQVAMNDTEQPARGAAQQPVQPLDTPPLPALQEPLQRADDARFVQNSKLLPAISSTGDPKPDDNTLSEGDAAQPSLNHFAGAPLNRSRQSDALSVGAAAAQPGQAGVADVAGRTSPGTSQPQVYYYEAGDFDEGQTLLQDDMSRELVQNYRDAADQIVVVQLKSSDAAKNFALVENALAKNSIAIDNASSFAFSAPAVSEGAEKEAIQSNTSLAPSALEAPEQETLGLEARDEARETVDLKLLAKPELAAVTTRGGDAQPSAGVQQWGYLVDASAEQIGAALAELQQQPDDLHSLQVIPTDTANAPDPASLADQQTTSSANYAAGRAGKIPGVPLVESPSSSSRETEVHQRLTADSLQKSTVERMQSLRSAPTRAMTADPRPELLKQSRAAASERDSETARAAAKAQSAVGTPAADMDALVTVPEENQLSEDFAPVARARKVQVVDSVRRTKSDRHWENPTDAASPGPAAAAPEAADEPAEPATDTKRSKQVDETADRNLDDRFDASAPEDEAAPEQTLQFRSRAVAGRSKDLAKSQQSQRVLLLLQIVPDVPAAAPASEAASNGASVAGEAPAGEATGSGPAVDAAPAQAP